MTTSAVNAEMSFEDAMSSVASDSRAAELFPSCRAEPRRRDGWSNIRPLA